MPSSFEKLRDSVLRFAHVTKRKLDANFMRRERDELVHQLGEHLLALIERGELAEPAQVKDLLRDIRGIDEQREHRLREAAVIERELGGVEPLKS